LSYHIGIVLYKYCVCRNSSCQSNRLLAQSKSPLQPSCALLITLPQQIYRCKHSTDMFDPICIILTLPPIIVCLLVCLSPSCNILFLSLPPLYSDTTSHQEKFLRPETAEQAGRTGRRELSPDGSRRLGEEHSHSLAPVLKCQKCDHVIHWL
jgi:hypothetical protein